MKGHSSQFPIDVADLKPEWLVVRTKPRQERVAVCHLSQREVEPYCPLFLEPPWHLRAPKGPTPLFSGYIFVRCNPHLQLNAVSYCPGVLHLVRFDREPATVEQTIIDALKAREADRGYVVPTELELGIEDGRKVRVMAGPLEGMEGVFRGYLRGGQRARVLMEFLRRSSLVEVETELLAAVRA
jgi:transcriptional antiterminator RfaH